MKSNKKKALALEKKEEKENKKKAIELEKEEEKQDKENKKKAVELEKAEEGDTDSDEGAGSSGRITKILKMLEEEIVARSSKDSDPPAEPEKPEKPAPEVAAKPASARATEGMSSAIASLFESRHPWTKDGGIEKTCG